MDITTLLANTGGTDFSLAGMWEQMGIFAKVILVLLLLMFLLSLAIVLERLRAYSRSRRHSIQYIMLLRNSCRSASCKRRSRRRRPTATARWRRSWALA
ncbi:hypothetical protein [Nannocystis pusilla]|uniref:hypothetical protein n=1 Tax=Nannocystis pusilla TaxID=889268 RepID=UPI003B7871C2